MSYASEDDSEAYDFNLAEHGGEDEEYEAKETAAYRVITSDALRQLQDDAVRRATSTLACTPSVALIALRYFRWNYDRLMEAVADGDKDEVFAAAGAQTSGQAAEQDAASGSMCMICMDDLLYPAQGLTMDCGHTFCKRCWLAHFQVKIEEGNACNVPCMAYKCGAICNHTLVRSLLEHADPSALAKYEHAMVNSYIEDNSKARWCPSVPCCGRAIEVLDDAYCEPRCTCGLAFCFKCGDAAHSPCTCVMWKDWQSKQSDDSETRHYLQANVKPCPKCTVPVEKDGGCNLVVCRSCRQPFCWLCGAKTGTGHTWTQIDGHTCGEWRAGAEQKEQNSKARLERYLHYHNHWKGHRESSQKEDMTIKIQQLLPLLRERVSGSVDWSYLKNGNVVLLECRRVLSNAYVFSYFMFDPDNFKQDMTAQENLRLQYLFEDSMSTLTCTVEKLSKGLDAELNNLRQMAAAAAADSDSDGSSGAQDSKRARMADLGSDFEEERRIIINLTVNIDKRISNLFHMLEKDILAAVCSINMQIANPSRGQMLNSGC